MKGYEYSPVIDVEINEKYHTEAMRVLKWLSKCKVNLCVGNRIEILDRVFLVDEIKYREFNIEVNLTTYEIFSNNK